MCSRPWSGTSLPLAGGWLDPTAPVARVAPITATTSIARIGAISLSEISFR
jgi:hypothetical protein